MATPLRIEYKEGLQFGDIKSKDLTPIALHITSSKLAHTVKLFSLFP